MQSNEASPASGLTSFIQNVLGDESLRIEERLGAGFVRLKVSEAERRQAKHDIQYVEDAVCEMVRNSRDAHARHVFVASTRDGSKRNILVIDDGDGVPPSIAEMVFEPRVTSKLESMHMDRWGVHGRGMALYSIRQNALESRIVCSDAGKGCSMSVVFDTDAIPERADQSTYPTLVADPEPFEEGEPVCDKTRGPHNIVRTVADVALDCPDSQKFFVGSPAEVLATLVVQGRTYLASHLEVEREGCAFWLLPAYAGSPAELQQAAETLGIAVSQRSCYRILNFEVAPLSDIRRALRGGPSEKVEPAPVDLLKDRRGLKLSKEDVEEFTVALRRDFEPLAQRYYIDLASEPRVRVSQDKIVVTFPIEKQW